MQNARKFVSVDEAAEYLGLSTKTIRNMIDRGDLPAWRIGRNAIRLDLRDLDAMITPVGRGHRV